MAAVEKEFAEVENEISSLGGKGLGLSKKLAELFGLHAGNKAY